MSGYADEVLRIVNATLALACALGYTHTRIWHGRHGRSSEETALRLGLAILMFAVAYRSAEAMAQDAPLGFGVVFYTLAFIVVQLGLWQTRPRNTHRRKP